LVDASGLGFGDTPKLAVQTSRRRPSPRCLDGVRNVARHRHPGLRNVVRRQPHAVHDRMPIDDPLRDLHVVLAHRVGLVLDRDAGSKEPADDALGVFCAAPSHVQVLSPGVAGGLLGALVMKGSERLGSA
jgi:hypothetical protein